MKPDDYNDYDKYREYEEYKPNLRNTNDLAITFEKIFLEELNQQLSQRPSSFLEELKRAVLPKREPTEPIVTKESAAELSRWFAL